MLFGLLWLWALDMEQSGDDADGAVQVCTYEVVEPMFTRLSLPV